MPISKLQGVNVISPLFIHHATLDPELPFPRHEKRSLTEEKMDLGKIFSAEVFETIVSVSKVRYFLRKVTYRYRISIEIHELESIVSVSVSTFQNGKYQYRYHLFLQLG